MTLDIGVEIGSVGKIEVGRLLLGGDVCAELSHERGDGGIVAHARQPHDIGLEAIDDARPGAGQLGQAGGGILDQNVAVLRDGLAHPGKLQQAAATHGDERPHHDHPARLPADDDGERTAAIAAEVVIAPVPVPIEGLEQLGAAPGAIEQRIPFRRQGVETGARRHELIAARLAIGHRARLGQRCRRLLAGEVGRGRAQSRSGGGRC